MAATDTHERDRIAALALLAAVIVAMILANSPLADEYHELLLRRFTVGLAPLALTKTLLHWINDGLMTLFFLLIGIEMKREILVGELASLERAMLPAIAALGGMLVPALVYEAVNHATVGLPAGWPIPMATDIAFAVGVLALLGRGMPPTLRIFLLALAVIDDLGAIGVIAILFTESLSWTALLLASGCVLVLIGLNRGGVRRVWPYALVGALLWLSVLKSGVHATLAGVLLGFAIPLARAPRDPAARVERRIYPRVTFVILPLFALANAGVPMAQVTWEVFAHPVTLGISLGLLLGKFIGVFTFTWLAVRWGLGKLPAGVGWQHVAGVALLTGIGFTMSLFLGALALPEDAMQGYVRLGVLSGSTCAALLGAWWLRRAARGAMTTGAKTLPSNGK